VNPGEAALRIDPEAEVARIASVLRGQVSETLRRRGIVIGMSGGVDSSVCAALAVRALGRDRVFGLFMPERDSDPSSTELARDFAGRLGIEAVVEDIGPILEAAGCYARRDEAVRLLFPDFEHDWGCKLVLSADRLRPGSLGGYHLVVQSPRGEPERRRLPPTEYRQIVAATNFKQRVRKMMEYYHADRLHYAVLGTPNRVEYHQGFFVKGGDGLADVKPIAHLYKGQVYQVGEYLGVPDSILGRPPTTDTFSMPQGQEEFYFSVPLKELDLILYAREAGIRASDASAWVDRTPEEVQEVYRDIDRKRRTTRYLHTPPLLVNGQVEADGASGDGASSRRRAGS
jgi:NAD+ synthase